ncbi:MAG: DUF2878 family protein [Hyphomicrobiaceae bacterium]
MSDARIQAILIVGGFDLVWVAAAYGGATSRTGWPGLVAVALFLALLGARGRISGREFGPLMGWALVGFVVELAFVGAGWIAYTSTYIEIFRVPLWVIALWVAFGAALVALWRPAKPPLALLWAFALAAPLAYLAGASFGALTIAPLSPARWLLISLAYVCALTALTRLPCRGTQSFLPKRSASS